MCLAGLRCGTLGDVQERRRHHPPPRLWARDDDPPSRQRLPAESRCFGGGVGFQQAGTLVSPKNIWVLVSPVEQAVASEAEEG